MDYANGVLTIFTVGVASISIFGNRLSSACFSLAPVKTIPDWNRAMERQLRLCLAS